MLRSRSSFRDILVNLFLLLLFSALLTSSDLLLDQVRPLFQQEPVPWHSTPPTVVERLCSRLQRDLNFEQGRGGRAIEMFIASWFHRGAQYLSWLNTTAVQLLLWGRFEQFSRIPYIQRLRVSVRVVRSSELVQYGYSFSYSHINHNGEGLVGGGGDLFSTLLNSCVYSDYI